MLRRAVNLHTRLIDLIVHLGKLYVDACTGYRVFANNPALVLCRSCVCFLFALFVTKLIMLVSSIPGRITRQDKITFSASIFPSAYID